MKNLSKYFLFGLAAVIFFGCSPKGTVTVGADHREGVDISEFRTYSWFSNDGEMPTTQIIIGSQSAMIFHREPAKSNIKEAIETQLAAKGFTEDKDNPDMLVNYSVLEEAGQLRTFRRGGQTFVGEGPTGRNVQMVNVEPGTILVNFTDAESGLQVWQGFASGALQEDDVKDKQTLQAKVGAIFDQFDFSGFSLNTVQAGR
jgi:hypothetical protein